MSDIANQLLKKVKESIQLRDVDSAAYKASFKNPTSFITATIGGQQEFVPINLLCNSTGCYQTLLNLYLVFGKPEANLVLNGRLESFYKQHNIEGSEQIESELTYYVKPAPRSDIDAFFDVTVLEKMSTYAGTRYKASDIFLKDLGNTYADEIVDKTNEWVNSITLPTGYVIEPERYWQVAGRFKSFTWAKIYKKEHKDKKVFFSVGVDVQNQKLVIKLDVLRSGTHKLSNFEIRDFDYFTQNKELTAEFDVDSIAKLDIDALVFITNQFIETTKTIYEQLIDFIWNDTVDCTLFTNKLFKLSTNYTSEQPSSGANIIENNIIDLIISYEKYVLSHADHTELAKNVEKANLDDLHIIKSFETDGKPKTILYQASTGGTSTALEMSRNEIEYLGDNLHTFLYHIVEYNIDNNSGKLIIRKGSPTKYAELKSTYYTVKIG